MSDSTGATSKFGGACQEASVDAIDIPNLINVLKLSSSVFGHDVSTLLEQICRCSLADDEIGVAELSRLFGWVLGDAAPTLN
ncbi:MAG: hypothetical protein ACTHMG_09890 [Sphingomonas sp.]